MYKKIFSSIKEYKKTSLLSMFFMALEVLLEVLIPFLMAKVLDIGFESKNIAYISKLGVIMIIITLFAMFFGVLSNIYSAKAACGLAYNLRNDIYKNIQSFSFSNIDKFSTPSLITRLTTDVSNIQMAYQYVLKIIIRAPFMAVFAFVMAFYTNHNLAFKLLFIAPILAFILIAIVFKVHPYFVRVFKHYDLLNQKVQEKINGIKAIKSYVQEDNEIKEFKKESTKIRDLFVKAEGITALNSPIIQITVYLALLMIYWFGAKYIVSGTMQTGELASFITYTILILNSMMMVSVIFVMFAISEASIGRISEVLKEKSDIINPKQDIKKLKDASIVFKDVYFGYLAKKSKCNISNINLNILSGQTIGIIGGTGSGKSTLIQLIPRLYDATFGEVIVGGHNVKDYDLKSLRDEIAFVLQKNTLFSGSVFENLKWGNEKLSLAEAIKACKIAQADEFIQKMPKAYHSLLTRSATNLSGGQKQRLSIARALLKKPKILILDDSTSAVDTKTERLILQALNEQARDMTKIIVAQRISSVKDADQIIVLDKGQIKGIGKHEDLLKTNQIYKEVYESQIKLGSIE